MIKFHKVSNSITSQEQQISEDYFPGQACFETNYPTIERNIPLSYLNLPKLIIKQKCINFHENKQKSMFNHKSGQTFSSKISQNINTIPKNISIQQDRIQKRISFMDNVEEIQNLNQKIKIIDQNVYEEQQNGNILSTNVSTIDLRMKQKNSVQSNLKNISFKEDGQQFIGSFKQGKSNKNAKLSNKLVQSRKDSSQINIFSETFSDLGKQQRRTKPKIFVDRQSIHVTVKELLNEKLNIQDYKKKCRFPDFGFDDFLNLEKNQEEDNSFWNMLYSQYIKGDKLNERIKNYVCNSQRNKDQYQLQKLIQASQTVKKDLSLENLKMEEESSRYRRRGAIVVGGLQVEKQRPQRDASASSNQKVKVSLLEYESAMKHHLNNVQIMEKHRLLLKKKKNVDWQEELEEEEQKPSKIELELLKIDELKVKINEIQERQHSFQDTIEYIRKDSNIIKKQNDQQIKKRGKELTYSNINKKAFKRFKSLI